MNRLFFHPAGGAALLRRRLLGQMATMRWRPQLRALSLQWCVTGGYHTALRGVVHRGGSCRGRYVLWIDRNRYRRINTDPFSSVRRCWLETWFW